MKSCFDKKLNIVFYLICSFKADDDLYFFFVTVPNTLILLIPMPG